MKIPYHKITVKAGGFVINKDDPNKEWALLEGWKYDKEGVVGLSGVRLHWQSPTGPLSVLSTLPDWTEPNRFFGGGGVVDKLEELKYQVVIKRIGNKWSCEIYSPSGNIHRCFNEKIGIAGLTAAVQARKETVR